MIKNLIVIGIVIGTLIAGNVALTAGTEISKGYNARLENALNLGEQNNG